MGFTPQQVDEMTLWQFTACIEGYAAAHGGRKRRSEGDLPEEELKNMGIEGF